MQKKTQPIENNSLLQKKTERPLNDQTSLPIQTKTTPKATNFRILEPYRSLGLITDNNKAVFFKRNNERFMLCSNETSFLLYNLEKLRLERISPPMDKKLTALASYKNKILTGINGRVQLWDKIHIIKEYYDSTSVSDVKQILTFDNVLLYTNAIGDLYIFNIDSNELISHLKLRIDTLIHPTTYFNRILFSVLPERYNIDMKLVNYQPELILYNINSDKEIFNFKEDMIKEALITSIEQSPVIDIIGIGYSNGSIVLFNLKTSKKVLTLQSDYPIHCMSFSTCSSMNHSLLATVTSKGDINLWDLNKKTIHYTISKQFTHVSSLMFLVNEPILVCTSGEDNSIKMFKLDHDTSYPSLLKFRSGHRGSPKYIRFYGENAMNESKHIISIDDFHMRNMSVINEHLSKEFSFKKYNDYLNDRTKLKAFDYNEFREHDWANIALCLDDLEYPLLMSYENGAIAENQPTLKTKNSKCTSVTISMCGNFCFCGFDNGTIEQINMQSGLSKWTIPNAHNKAVTNLKCDGINSMLVSISTEEKCVKFWEIYKHTLIQSISLDYFPHQIELNRDNDLLGMSLTSNDICLYDKSQMKLVRKFSFDQPSNDDTCDISDFNISKNAKWIIGLIKSKRSLKIFDILSSNLIEWVTFDYEPLSISISPNNQYISLSFEGLKGIYLYLNRTLFVDFEDIESITAPIHCVMNTFKAKKIKQRKDFNAELNKDETTNPLMINGKFKEKNQPLIPLAEENKQLVSFSNQNSMKYRIIYNLEEIQEKNDPKVKNKEKAKAPFFLFNINDVIEGKLPVKAQPGLLGNANSSPEFLSLLKNYSHFKNEKTIEERKLLTKENDFILKQLLLSFKQKKVLSSEITSFLNSLNPYVLDLEIRSLDPLIVVDEHNYLDYFLEYLLNELSQSSGNFEMLQAYLNRFIKIFSEELIRNDDMRNKIGKVNQLTEEKFDSIDELYKSTMCLISYFGKIQL